MQLSPSSCFDDGELRPYFDGLTGG
jgi:hypothetical protein